MKSVSHEYIEKVINASSDNEKAVALREHRDAELAISDWTQMPDADLDADTKAAWATYRQELRDLPSQEGFPNVGFPRSPDFPEPFAEAHAAGE